MRPVLIAAAALTLAASACAPAQNAAPQVEATASGLTDSEANTPERQPTFVETGAYVGRVVRVVQSHEDRTDLVEGAKYPIDIEEDANGRGYVVNGMLPLQGWDGKLRGEVATEEFDPNYDCSMTVEVRVRGRTSDGYRMQFAVEESVFVEGTECDFSDIGPAREEENIYRMRVTPER